jgi:hypothetical protein
MSVADLQAVSDCLKIVLPISLLLFTQGTCIPSLCLKGVEHEDSST